MALAVGGCVGGVIYVHASGFPPRHLNASSYTHPTKHSNCAHVHACVCVHVTSVGDECAKRILPSLFPLSHTPPRLGGQTGEGVGRIVNTGRAAREARINFHCLGPRASSSSPAVHAGKNAIVI
ncbi:unnamed protein product [Schistocephalus solidus]|uniref:Secreted protein n=1 Tax=Schistocephalus solidus TaxID=70667 RepID=A0A183TLC0_SCHSO|nr:unnamed protein product [Schistocephalus solidus]